MGNLLSAHNSNVTLEDLKMGESFSDQQVEDAKELLKSVNGVLYELALNDVIDHEVEVLANEPKGEIASLNDPDNEWGQFLSDDFDDLGEMSILAVMGMSMLDPSDSVDALVLEFGNDAGGRVFNIPAAPSSAVAANAAPNVSLVWVDNSSNETSFEIQRKTGAGAFGALATVAADIETYLDTTVAAATDYTYRVRAVKTGAGNSAYATSNQVSTPP